MRLVNQIESEELVVTPRPCTLLGECVIEKGRLTHWRELAVYHYRSKSVPCCKAVYIARHVPSGRTVAVCVYAAPALNSQARNVVLNGYYLPGSTRGKKFMAQKLNEEMECLSRVVVHPTFRGCGLGARIVAETLPLRGRRYIESSTAMGSINPFFEHAGMTPHDVGSNNETGRVLAALRAFGISDEEICNPAALTRRIEDIPVEHRDMVVKELLLYEKFWIRGRTKRNAPITLDRAIRRVAGNALLRPRYYLWSSPIWKSSSP